MDSFQYLPLAGDGQQEIRLVRLLPATSHDPIVCQIMHASFADAQPYEALSYCWGDASDKETIGISETSGFSSFDVTTNLYWALFHLRLESQPRLMWIDAICINQQDVDERNAQVQLMRHIYQKAERVLIWVGEAADNSDEALELVPMINVAAALDSRDGVQRELWKPDQYHWFLPNRGAQVWYDLFEVFRRPWFQRAWIIQELAVASEATLACGTRRVEWTALLRAIEYLLASGAIAFLFGPAAMNHLLLLDSNRRKFAEKVELGPLQAFLRHRKALATDPRDHIFAFHGLFTKGGHGASLSLPDYRVDCKELYTRVALAMLEHDRNLDIFTVPRPAETSEVAGLPTWVPDWSVSDYCEALLWRRIEDGFPPEWQPSYRASGDSTYTPVVDDARAKLQVEVHGVDRIGLAGLVMEPFAKDVVHRRNVARAWKHDQNILWNWELITGARILWRTYPLTGEKIMDAYWQTLLGGCSAEDYKGLKMTFQQWDSQVALFRLVQMVRLDREWLLNLFIWASGYAAYIAYLLGWTRLANSLVEAPPYPFKLLATAIGLRRMIVTECGWIGLAPRLAQEGDFIVLGKGGKLPLVIRPNGQCWELLGDCYIHGLMDGEVWESLQAEEPIKLWLG